MANIKVPVTTKMDPLQRKKLDEIAKECKLSRYELIRRTLIEALKL